MEATLPKEKKKWRTRESRNLDAQEATLMMNAAKEAASSPVPESNGPTQKPVQFPQDSPSDFLTNHRTVVQRILTDALEAIMDHTQSSQEDQLAELRKGMKTVTPRIAPYEPSKGDSKPSEEPRENENRVPPSHWAEDEAQRDKQRDQREKMAALQRNYKIKKQAAAVGDDDPGDDRRKVSGYDQSTDLIEAEDMKQQDTMAMKKAVFPDASTMKEQVRQALAKPDYQVSVFYKKTGICQAIATNVYFENLTLVVIAINAIWIAVDTDNNDANLLIDADPVFQVADNLFCAYFVFEWAVRFGAFRLKSDGLKDSWFIFDTLLAALMAAETWLLTLVLLVAGGGSSEVTMGDTSLLKGFRLVRLVRMARVIRLLNALPELMVMIKGMFVAVRAVSCTILLMMMIIYCFAVLFRQLTDGTDIGKSKFTTVPDSVRFLLLDGTLPDLAVTTNEIWDESLFFALIYLVFILVVSITVMNMLVGVLVGVVNTVATVEKEQLMVSFVKQNLLLCLQGGVKGECGNIKQVDMNGDQAISKDEFDVLITLPQAIRSFEQMGVDVVGLVDLADYIFKETPSLPFVDFMEICMQLRGTNQATVKDVVDLRKFINMEMRALHSELGLIDREIHTASKPAKETQAKPREVQASPSRGSIWPTNLSRASSPPVNENDEASGSVNFRAEISEVPVVRESWESKPEDSNLASPESPCAPVPLASKASIDATSEASSTTTRKSKAKKFKKRATQEGGASAQSPQSGMASAESLA